MHKLPKNLLIVRPDFSASTNGCEADVNVATFQMFFPTQNPICRSNVEVEIPTCRNPSTHFCRHQKCRQRCRHASDKNCLLFDDDLSLCRISRNYCPKEALNDLNSENYCLAEDSNDFGNYCLGEDSNDYGNYCQGEDSNNSELSCQRLMEEMLLVGKILIPNFW